MIRIGLTGNIASGKSAAEEYIRTLGYFVCDADKITHQLLEENSEVRNEIFEIFEGFDIKDKNGNISREKLGKIIFSSTEYKRKLEKILHKRIFREIEKFFEQHKNEKLVFASIPLLFETNCEYLFDKIIFISCNENIRLERLIKRNGYTTEYALKRIKSQQSEDEKIKKSDFVIKNEENPGNLYEQLKKTVILLNVDSK